MTYLKMKDELTNENMLTIGGQITYARKYRGVSQTELAKLLGVNRITLSNIERNVKKPSMKIIEDICSTLGFQVTLIPIYNHKLKIKKEEELNERKSDQFEFELPREFGATNESIKNDSSTA